MQEIIDILSSSKKILAIAHTTKETWGTITFYGNPNANFFSLIDELANIPNVNFFKANINRNLSPLSDFQSYKANPSSLGEWEIYLNKEPLINTKRNDIHYNFFLKSTCVEQWLDPIDLLTNDAKLNELSPLTIIIDDLKTPFGSKSLKIVTPLQTNLPHTALEDVLLPSNDKLHEEIHFVTKNVTQINLERFDIIYGDLSSPLAKIFLKKSVCQLAICTSTEFHNPQKIVIDGVKRLIKPLIGSGETVDFIFYQKLRQLISWMYEDRVSIRKKIFSERFSLEISESESLVGGLEKHIDNSFIQAKERYKFVIIDRKDAYAKELKELLKDLRGQSDIIASKIRTILSNLLRDALAGLVLVWFTLFTKLNENLGFDKSSFIKYVFFSLGCYYVIAGIFQAVVDFIDVRITNKELTYWKNVSKEYIPENEFNEHKTKSLQNRNCSIAIIYPIIVLLYLVIAVVCFMYPSIFHSFLHPVKG